jgi:hypothetical protein
MSGLVEWLSARLDEDERGALCATFCDPEDSASGDFTEWHVDAPNPRWPVAVNVANGTAIVAAGYNGAYEHIARWDPARVLAEVAAKRAILAEVQRRDAWLNMKTLVEPARSEATAMRDALVPVVRLLALPYADRPGYRDEWRLQ